MAIDLDSIIANSGSVDDLLIALQGEQAGTQKAAGQIQQLAEATKGSMNPLEWMKSKIAPQSTAGTLANDSDYKKYYLKTVEEGQEPVSKEEFLKQKATQPKAKG